MCPTINFITVKTKHYVKMTFQVLDWTQLIFLSPVVENCLCMCARVSERERERERVCVCACTYSCISSMYMRVQIMF